MRDCCLVTGGNGFIGSHLVEYLLEKGYRVVNYSRHTYASNPNNEQAINVEGDITDIFRFTEMLERYNVAKIFSMAAETHVDRSFQYPTAFLHTNLIGTVAILEAVRYMKQMRGKSVRLLQMSTDEVFGEVKVGFAKEGDAVAPLNPYSASKTSAEHFVMAYHHSYGLDTVICRSMNNFGERQNLEKIVGKIVLNCLNDREYTLYKGSSTSVRGWIYAKDTASALHTVMEKGRSGEVYHIPAKIYLSVEELNARITKLLGKEHLFKGWQGHRLKDDERYALDYESAKIVRELGWEPTTSFEDGILRMVSWIKQNRQNTVVNNG